MLKETEVSKLAVIGDSVLIRGGTVIREGAKIGARTRFGRLVYVGPGVTIGADCKIQNQAQIFEPAIIGNGCFIGPGSILTNDRHPRSVNLDGTQKTEADWVKAGVLIEEGVSLGAGVICVGPVTIGSWSFVAAGAVVVADCPPYSLLAGNPARKIGWVGKAGYRLEENKGRWICPRTGETFLEKEGCLVMLDQPEN